MRVLEEIGTVIVKTEIHPKLHNKDVTCMFIGYTKNYNRDCYQM